MADYYMMNKPAGYITSRSDPEGIAVMSLFPEELAAELHPIGRLDKDTEGLLLFTNDGMLDHHLLRPEHHVEKEYLYHAFGRLTDSDMERLRRGVKLPCGVMTMPAEAELLGYGTIGDNLCYVPQDRVEHFRKNPERPVTYGLLRIMQGRRHQVKLMVKAVGGHVFRLKRLAMGRLRLDDRLQPGEYRKLSDDEVRLLGYEPR